MTREPMSIEEINTLDADNFVGRLGFLFEGSPWIAVRAWHARPFAGVEHLHRSLCEVMNRATTDEKLALIQAHPDLAGQAARADTLTPESAGEQTSAGLDRLSSAELAKFERLNQAYKEKFGFPFVICARENRKDTILECFASRLSNSRSAEIEIALHEIARIAYLRILDVVRV
jgi:2-oxo-4-hydroxy-4-carboxy-5-ureidoimidazoline decarboxylase